MDIVIRLEPAVDDRPTFSQGDRYHWIHLDAANRIMLTADHVVYAGRMAEAWAEAADRLEHEASCSSLRLCADCDNEIREYQIIADDTLCLSCAAERARRARVSGGPRPEPIGPAIEHESLARALKDELIAINTDMAGDHGRMFIAPTAIGWISARLADAVLPLLTIERGEQ